MYNAICAEGCVPIAGVERKLMSTANMTVDCRFSIVIIEMLFSIDNSHRLLIHSTRSSTYSWTFSSADGW
jgi:hypothetical protein